MKKSLPILIAAVLAMSLAACGAPSSGDVQKPAEVSLENTGAEDSQQTAQQEKQDVTINEIVLVDDSGIKITAKSLDVNGSLGPEVKLLIENDSGKDLTFQCRSASVNGYMADTIMSVDVVNSKKANDGLTFMKSGLEACGIGEVADIELAFHIFDTSNWETYLDSEPVQIKTSIADSYEYIYDDSGDSAYNGNDIKIVIKGLSEDSSVFGPSIVVYIENNSGVDITVQTRDVSINGFMLDAIFSCDIAAGKRAVDTITFLDSALEENGITAIEDVELSFHIFDFAQWETIVDTEIVAIAFS